MEKAIKYLYYLLTVVFIILTFYEVFLYLRMDSNYFGIYYLFINLFIMFLLCSVSYNYNKGNKNVIFSKNVICIVLGVFSNFILFKLLSSVYGYVDSSSIFSSNIFIVSKIIKTFIYFGLLCMSVYEVSKVKKML